VTAVADGTGTEDTSTDRTMGTFEISRVVQAGPDAVWRVVTDFARYARWMPLTTMRLDPGPVRVGWSFAGRSGVGPLRFTDSMVVTHWAPPAGQGAGQFRVVKTGRVLSGWAVVSVERRGEDGGTDLHWLEDITLRPARLGGVLAPVVDPVNRAMFGHAVDAMVAEAEGTCNRG
jgi:uncharacterized protein YndB with AHSA1/START domain